MPTYESAESSAAAILDLLQGGDGRVLEHPCSLESSLSQIRGLVVPRGYGGLRIHEASAGQVITAGVAQKLTLWETALVEAGGVDGQVANDRIVVATAGVYLVGWHMGYSASGVSVWVGHIYLDGIDSGIDWDRNIAAAGTGSISCASPLTLPAGGVIEAYVEHDQGVDRTLIAQSAQLCVMRIG